MGSLQSVNIDTMIRHTFIPDYTVRAITEVFYVRIKRSLYLAAKKATLMEKVQKNDEHFDDEVDKVRGRIERSCPRLRRKAASVFNFFSMSSSSFFTFVLIF